MRPRARWPIAVLVLLVPACTTPPIPAPWEATEPQSAANGVVPTESRPNPKWVRVGASVRGKSIEAMTVGSGPRRIYIIGGIHGDEPEGPVVAERLPEALLDAPELERATIRIVRDMNPDGTTARTRTNTRKVDLERNWPAKDFIADARSGSRAASELEVSVLHRDLMSFNPDIVIVFQSANLPPTISFQGSARILAHEFATSARRVDPRWRFNPEPRARIPGSIESLFGQDLGKTVVRVDFQRGRDADLNARSMVAGILAMAEKFEPPAKAPGSETAPQAKPVARSTSAK